MVSPHRVVIIGGGFAGLSVARCLPRGGRCDACRPTELPPLPTAALSSGYGGLSPANISAPLRSVLKRQKNTRVLLAETRDFNLADRRVILS